MIRQIRGGNTSIKRKSCIARFQEAYIEVLKSYYICNVKPEEAYNNFLNTKTVRDIYLEFVETIAETESNYAETLAESFEYLYNKLTCVKTFNPQAYSANKNDLDVYKILLWELFICVIAYLRHIKDYEAINILLTYTYF